MPSPYKVIMIAAFILGRQKKAFKNGLVTIESIKPFYEKIASVLMPGSEVTDPMVVQPFWYLGAGQPKIWSLIPSEGASDNLVQAMLMRKQIKDLSSLRKLVSGAELSTPDFELLSDPLGARTVTRFLAGEYLAEHPAYAAFLCLF